MSGGIAKGNLKEEYATVKRQHPTLSDVALALATKRPSDAGAKVTVKDDNAKGQVHIAVEVSDTDPQKAAETADNLYAVLRAKYPRENGATP